MYDCFFKEKNKMVLFYLNMGGLIASQTNSI
jgi:hypothetical protein